MRTAASERLKKISNKKTRLVKSLSPGYVNDDPWFHFLGACKNRLQMLRLPLSVI